jgi:hypothetical protein
MLLIYAILMFKGSLCIFTVFYSLADCIDLVRIDHFIRVDKWDGDRHILDIETYLTKLQ